MSVRSTELLSLYEKLLQQVKSQYEDDKSLTANALSQQIADSKEYLAIKEQAKSEELALVEQFLKRDVAHFLQEQSADDLSQSPTVIMAERTLWHWLGEVADRSQIEWHELAQDLKHQGKYHSGEIIGQGVMVCSACQHEIKVEFPEVLSECPECHHSEFTREALAP